MILLIGPCMFLAPLVVLLIPIAIVLWPPSLILVGLAWLLLWPFAAMAKDEHAKIRRAHTKVGHWFRTLLTPWTYFDAPKAPPAQVANGTSEIEKPAASEDKTPPAK